MPLLEWEFLAILCSTSLCATFTRASHSRTTLLIHLLSCVSINPPWHANNFVEKIERPMRRPRTLQLITWPCHCRHTASGYRSHNLLWLTGSAASRERIDDARFFCRSFPSIGPEPARFASSPSLPRLIFKDLVEFPRDRRRYAVAYAQQDPPRAAYTRSPRRTRNDCEILIRSDTKYHCIFIFGKWIVSSVYYCETEVNGIYFHVLIIYNFCLIETNVRKDF